MTMGAPEMSIRESIARAEKEAKRYRDYASRALTNYREHRQEERRWVENLSKLREALVILEASEPGAREE